MIDPEALVLLSASLMKEERRLADILGWWASVGSPLMSVQRLRSLTRQFPDQVKTCIGLVAVLSYRAGDHRWKQEAKGLEEPSWIRSGKGGKLPDLNHSATLWLRLRAGFGVGVKTDLLACLIGTQGTAMTIRQLSHATSYTAPALRAALQGMVIAGIVQATPQRPAMYRLDAHRWNILLSLDERSMVADAHGRSDGLPRWITWSGFFAFLCDTLVWSRDAATAEIGDYILSSRARDLYEKYAGLLKQSGIAVPDPSRYKGKAYLEGFETTVHTVLEWIDMHL
jgi:hypothetical protein